MTCTKNWVKVRSQKVSLPILPQGQGTGKTFLLAHLPQFLS